MIINHYEILGVDPDAELVQITAAWKRLLRKYHPDINQGDEDATEQTILLNKAYEILSDPKKRQKFDKQLEQQTQATESSDSGEETEAQASSDSYRPRSTQNGDPPFTHASPQQDHSFAAATKQAAKKNRNGLVFGVVGIGLGALTAIPIGLFLVWTISGFDPLGIFREKPDANLAENEASENPDDENKKIDGSNQNDSNKSRQVKPPKVDNELNSSEEKKETKTHDNSAATLSPEIIAISYAKFGESRQSVRVEKFVEDVANKTDVVTPITTEGLNTTNRFGGHRTALRVTYQINGEKTGTISFPNGAEVMIREAILKHAKENARPFKEIEITYALFGKQRNKVRCEEQVAAVASQVDTISPITTHGLSLRNPSGIVRHELDIQYKVAGKTGSMTLKYGEKLDLRKTILQHAKVLDGSYVPSDVKADGSHTKAQVATNNPKGKSDGNGKQPVVDSDPTNVGVKPTKEENEQTVSLIDNRLPVPPENDVKTARSKIAEIFKSDYEAAKRSKGPDELAKLGALAKEVMKLAEKENDPATLYAIFEAAINLARESCHESHALDYVQRFELRFKIDGLQRRVNLLKVLRRELPLSIRNKVKLRAVANMLRASSKMLYRQSIDEQRWSIAKEICVIYRGFCLLSGEKVKAAALKQALTSLEKKEAEATRYFQYLKDKDATSKDGDKLLAIGSYLCFTKQEWGKGLTYISDGSDSKLASLADSDMAANENDYLSIGDRWWDLALDENYANHQLAILTRAKYYYWLAFDNATGLDKSKIEKRLKEANAIIWGDGFFFDWLNNRTSPSTGMKFIKVKNGTFEMGEHQKNIDAFRKQASNYRHEGPRHSVTISKSFFMGQFEVTQEQWIKVMGTQPWTSDEIFGREAHFPVAHVSWNDAKEFCKRLSILDKQKYRLPTEAEWEYACRGATTTRYFTGDPDASIFTHEWVRENAYVQMGWRSAQQVGTKLPNPYGFYDILGNMFEWCEDTYEPDFYSRSPKVDPVNRASGVWKVCRSGSIYSNSFSTRSASRQKAGPDERTRVIGFRVVMEN